MGRRIATGLALAAALLLSLLPCAAAHPAMPQAPPASAEDLCHHGAVTVHPAAPTRGDIVSLVVLGWWGSSCPAVTCEHAMAGYGITLIITVTDVQTTPPIACLDVVTPWAITHGLGYMPPGDYTVQADCNAGTCWSFQDKVTFRVWEALGVQRTYLPAVLHNNAGTR